MTRRTLFVTAIAAAAFCLVVPPASATHVPCGTTITTKTTLDSDINCAAGQLYGLIIGASGVTVNLNGYTIRGVPSTGGSESIGIYGPELETDTLSNVVIKGSTSNGGAIEGFDHSVYMGGVRTGASNITVHRLTSRTTQGIRLLGQRVTVSKVELTDGHIFVEGNDPFVWGTRLNVPMGSQGDWQDYVIAVIGDRLRVTDNHILCQAQGCSSDIPGGNGQAAINVRGSNARVDWNTVTGDYSGGVLVNSDGGRVRENESVNNHGGVFVYGQGAVAGSNVGNNLPGGDAFAYGIYAGAGVTVRRNSATGNSSYGIYAEDGAIDGGGNTASGNGQDCTPNIQCSSP